MLSLKEYAEGIKFIIPPLENGLVLRCIHLSDVVVDMRMTTLPEDDAATKTALEPLLRMPRMSTFAVAAIINKCVGEMEPDTAFVNVGVWNGFTLLAGMAGHEDRTCVGIDNFSEFGGPELEFRRRFNAMKSDSHFFHKMDYQDYFKNRNIKIGFYIYDGSHSRNHQFQGLAAAEPYFSSNCIILVDDINLDDAVAGTNDFLAQSQNKYENIFTCTTRHNFHPTFWNGVQLLRRCPC